MSDIAPQFYEAFCTVNECQPKRLLCTWHVDIAWKEELRKKIGNIEIEAEVHKMMRVVLEQVDEKLFDDYLSNLMERLEDHQRQRVLLHISKHIGFKEKGSGGSAFELEMVLTQICFVRLFIRYLNSST